MSSALDAIQRERHNQTEKNGWDATHDDGHTQGELAAAAACMLDPLLCSDERPPEGWPWSQDHWDKHLARTRRRQLSVAGALIIAEMERVERLPKHGLDEIRALSPAEREDFDRFVERKGRTW